MNHLNTKTQAKTNRSSVSTLALLSAKISLKFGLMWREFMEYYKQHLVKQTKKNNPDYSIVEIASRTGIDRRDIKKYLNIDEPSIRPSKIKLTLQEIKSICERNKSHLILKKGPFQSFESICYMTASGTLTPQSIAKELIRLGNIKDNGKYYELINWKYTTESDESYFSFLINELNRMTDTTVENLENPVKENRKVQRNLYSTLINPKDFNLAHKEVREVLYESFEKIGDILMSYEEEVPRKTYPAFGASMYTFGPDHNKNIIEPDKSKDIS